MSKPVSGSGAQASSPTHRLTGLLTFGLAFLAGCSTANPIGKAVMWSDSFGHTNIIQYRRIVTGGIVGPRQSLIIAEVIAGNAPVVISTANGPPLAQSVLGPVSIAAGYVWGQSARKPDENNTTTTTAVIAPAPPPATPGRPPPNWHDKH